MTNDFLYKLPSTTPVMHKVCEVKSEAEGVVTLFFSGQLNVKPGQFVMVWIPGVEQKPYSISYYNENKFGITIKAYGNFSEHAQKLKEGALVGLSGPYGNSFSVKKNTLFIGGGVGIASLSTAIDTSDSSQVIIGALTKNAIVYKDRYANALFATDDGSFGHKGYVTDLFESIIEDKKPSLVITCGPEKMMKKVLDICVKNKIECELSLERYMGCGFGICGKCVCGDKIVCMDGPIFKGSDIENNADFGLISRKKNGMKCKV